MFHSKISVTIWHCYSNVPCFCGRHVIRHQQKEERVKQRKQQQQQQQLSPSKQQQQPQQQQQQRTTTSSSLMTRSRPRRNWRNPPVLVEPSLWACPHCRLMFYSVEVLDIHVPIHSAAVIPADEEGRNSKTRLEECPECCSVSNLRSLHVWSEGCLRSTRVGLWLATGKYEVALYVFQYW